jgi:uncharacterized protein YbjT (DUF2867 family)
VSGRGIVVVTGATGRQGRAVTRALLAAGWPVRAMTRHPEKPAARDLADSGAEVVVADMEDTPALDRAFTGAYGVYSVQNFMTSGLDGEVRQGRNVGDAAHRAGIRHLVQGSAGTGERGTGVGSFESKLDIEEHLAELGLPVTVLRPMAFMECVNRQRCWRRRAPRGWMRAGGPDRQGRVAKRRCATRWRGPPPGCDWSGSASPAGC